MMEAACSSETLLHTRRQQFSNLELYNVFSKLAMTDVRNHWTGTRFLNMHDIQ
jgi:hypothetical protein